MVALHKGWLTICILPGTVCKYDKDLKEKILTELHINKFVMD